MGINMGWIKDRIGGKSPDKEIDTLKERMENLYLQKNYDEALALAITIRDESEKQFGEESAYYACAINDIGLIYESMGKSELTEPLYLKALDIRKRVVGIRHPDYAETLNNLGLYYGRTGSVQKAEEMLREALDIRRSALGEVHPMTGQSLHNLASFLGSQGRYSSAEKYAQEAIAVKKQLEDTSTDSLIGSLLLLGEMYAKEGKDAQAEAVRQVILGLIAHPGEADDVDLISRVPRLQQEINALYNRGEYGMAIERAQEVCQIIESSIGENSPEYATSLINCANICMMKDAYQSTALSQLQVALDIRKQVFGDKSPQEGEVMFLLGTAHLTVGSPVEARKWINEAIALRKSIAVGWNDNIARELDALIEEQRQREAKKKSIPPFLREFSSQNVDDFELLKYAEKPAKMSEEAERKFPFK